MASEYSRNMIKVSIAKMLQTLGWNSIQSTPLEILTDISTQYIIQLARTTHDYANEFGCVDPSLDHLGLAFKDHHINLQELEEYVKYVNFGPAPTPVPKYPVAKENSLNFLKPGSKEVVIRQVHVHEHLPPMCEDEVKSEVSTPTKQDHEENSLTDEPTTPVFKRPAEVSPGDSFKRPRPLSEEEGRPTREISSVMMTTSGYISPAREGKLPESRTPVGVEAVLVHTLPNSGHSNNKSPPMAVHSASLAPLSSPVITSTTNINAPTNADVVPAKIAKLGNKKAQERAEKKKLGKELFRNGALHQGPPLNMTTEMKVAAKVKRLAAKELKKQKNLASANAEGKAANNALHQKSPVGANKVNKALAAARLKTEKLNTTITPIPTASPKTASKIDKLLTEPDKKKVNILKKISNVKNEKPEKVAKVKDGTRIPSDENPPDLIVDEQSTNNDSKLHISNDITIELVDPASKNQDTYDNNKAYYDDDSPPGTPSTPKTPEMMSQSPPIVREKKKRKDKTKVKKSLKGSSPIRENDSSLNNLDFDRPKTPQPHILPGPQFPLFPFPGGPGLIPGNPLFPMGPMMFGLPTGPNPLIPPLRPGFPGMIPPPIVKHPTEEPMPPKSPIKNSMIVSDSIAESPKSEIKKKKDKKDKIKKKNKKDKLKNKAEKKKLKEEKKDKIKKIKKDKRKEKEKDVKESLEITVPKLTLKLGTPSPRPDTPDTKKLNIKPIVKREPDEEVEIKRELSPELAKISALVTGQPKPKSSPVIHPKEEIKEEPVITPAVQKPHPGPGRPRIHPIKAKPLKSNKRPLPVKDSEGNTVWICPGCGRQDDGSPMIGCDDCDAWYHWVCVGIQVPPDETENWYCRQCIVKKQENLQPDKKKKRKKREKKEH